MKDINLNQPVGLALGSGSARGLAHIGVLKYFEDNNIKVGWIAGSSMGALIGAAYALGISSNEMIQIAENLDWKLMVKLFSPSISGRGMISDRYLIPFLQSLYGDAKIEDLKIPFGAVSTDLYAGERIVISQGNLVEAVRASISIPVILHPIRIGNHTLVDGGLVDPVPVEVVKQMGADQVIAVDVAISPKKAMKDSDDIQYTLRDKISAKINQTIPSEGLYQRMARFLRMSDDAVNDNLNIKSTSETDKIPNLFKIFWQSVTIAEQELTRLHLKVCPPDVIIKPDTGSIQLWEFARAMEAIEAGEKAAKSKLKKLTNEK
ncbi:MAG: patatin-like phospholipase family protein [candidate division Zixibacteria bacterium]|nr:patatin-like phospholipase family protein [candidate division Zixibacteria bacterium]